MEKDAEKPQPPEGVDPELWDDPDFRRVMEDALGIQDRFAAEPVYARTGRGYLRSAGVAELARLKEEEEGEYEAKKKRATG